MDSMAQEFCVNFSKFEMKLCICVCGSNKFQNLSNEFGRCVSTLFDTLYCCYYFQRTLISHSLLLVVVVELALFLSLRNARAFTLSLSLLLALHTVELISFSRYTVYICFIWIQPASPRLNNNLRKCDWFMSTIWCWHCTHKNEVYNKRVNILNVYGLSLVSIGFSAFY